MEDKTYTRFKQFVIEVMDAEREAIEQDVEVEQEITVDFEFADAA